MHTRHDQSAGCAVIRWKRTTATVARIATETVWTILMKAAPGIPAQSNEVTKMKTKLAPGRVRCQCCRKSMAKSKGDGMRSPLTGRIVNVHYLCLSAHISNRGARCVNRRFH
jgi:hypothetical protein